MPYYYDLRIVRWLAGRTRRKKLEQHQQQQNLTFTRPRYSLASLMCLDRSHIHDETLRHAVWYQAGLPREIALEILQQEEVGAFVVRDSSTHPGCYALSVRVPRFENASGISHYLVLRTQRGVKLKGLDKEWSTLAALVTHHTVMRELLPCTLRLPKIKAAPSASPSHAPAHTSPQLGAATGQDTRYTRTSMAVTSINGSHGAGVNETMTSVCNSSIVSTREQIFHQRTSSPGRRGGGGGGARGGAVREREAGVMYTDNYSYLSEMAEFVDQLKL
ncbi:tensin-4 [Plakobranchus ocellatus]|uniref:Tensin-4 n=1 Tax=Plakobranchus ocellatus TaxID=259542 RepID=A0AAV4CRB3_9GAST|nr:tensin-4 [Plakobranchus ocellatus]